MTSFLHSVLGYVGLIGLTWILGACRRPFPTRTVLVATTLQFAFAAVVLLTGLRQHVFGFVTAGVDLLRETALRASQSLLFVGVTNEEFTKTYGPIIALEIAAIVIFVASLSRILYHYRILPSIISALGRFMQRVFGISAAESVGVAGNIFLGMTEAPLLIRPYVLRLTESELFCIMTAGMATIAGTVMVVYASMLVTVDPQIAGHLFTASLISAPAAIAVAKVMIPESEQPLTTGRHIEIEIDDSRNGLDAAARGASEGMSLTINILAMLIAFIGLIALLNSVIGIGDRLVNGVDAGSWSMQAAVGFFFRYPVWLMGVSWEDAQLVGRLMGVKTILNEFVAYAQLSGLLQQNPGALSPRTVVITTYALCGFANFGSVAIMIGGIGGIAPERRGDLARLGFRSIVAGTMATMLTGAAISFFV
jgi:CNT family concentrative nucleoside transporter